MTQDWHWEFFSDPSEFLHHAHDYLRHNAVECCVPASVAQRARDDDRDLAAVPGAPYWWAVVRAAPGEGSVLGTAMRASNLRGRPLYVTSLPAGAGVALADALIKRAEPISAVNGALAAGRECLSEYAARSGSGQGSVHVEVATRLHELGVLTPLTADGEPRTATVNDLELALSWFEAFGREADLQAGRPVGAHPIDLDPEAKRQRLEQGLVLLWTVDGVPVQLTGFRAPAFGVSTIGPVYTPPEHRGHGYAGAAVSAVAQQLQRSGVQVCLFTDQANPVSNRLYARMGFRPVTEMANLVLSDAR